ncbi:hypothetical protein L202_00403 [Cryptococcus amylolentus CBS 6039]|uniref:Major facilitator superfamily (MFS) profile domain-containing protein n=1 Tax=Cryptococcus amylolentus CBS 6039 TaxID=1295533 RepID=A0A1E3I771_9TREE|nr:hypothetical protein L202_00403 [Cryptococcus amylolentus CBS 6039]ODN84454.1 hypothetical protein L202_00403 [Cryptococcus amylolentus CBS 6039]
MTAAPSYTIDGSLGDTAVRVATLPDPQETRADNDAFDIDQYRQQVPKWKRIRDHSLTQMLMMSALAFCGPAMGDAIGGLGGGGLATPTTSNIATAISYSMLASVCFFGGPIVNTLGTKWALVIGAATFPIRGSAYYCNSKFGNQWYLILSAFIGGIGSGCWYVAEAGTIMSIAPGASRGKYLALWIVARNLGQLIGGAINLSKNHASDKSGGVTPSTYLVFVAIESVALPFALLISPLERVVRSDGTRIRIEEKKSAKEELFTIKKTIFSKLILLSAPWAFWSFFYSGSWSTYLSLYFSVRARALSSLISPFFCIVGCFGLGYVLDLKNYSQRRRAQFGLALVVLTNAGVYIWSIIEQVKFIRDDPGAIDWSDKQYAAAFLPYFFVQTTGPLSQSYMYWVLSSFADNAQANVRNGAAFRCMEAIGQAVAYGMNTKVGSNPLVGFCVTAGLMVAALPTFLVLANSTPDRIPADILLEEETRNAKNEDDGIEDKKDPALATIVGSI